jgi:hypothetical protein
VANVHSLGFADDTKREAARAAWKEHLAKRNAQASAQAKE